MRTIMTIEDFLTALDEAITALQLRPAGDAVGSHIRFYAPPPPNNAYPTCYCPVTAVAQYRVSRYFPVVMVMEAAQAMGLPLDDANDIALAADLSSYPGMGRLGRLIPLRRRLLDIVQRPH